MYDELIQQIGQWHNKYCAIVEQSLPAPAVGWKRPKAVLMLGTKAQRACGRFKVRKNTCYYALCYAIIEKEKFADTVAHEVAHSYTWQVMPSADWHGDLWKYIFRKVLGFADGGRISKSGCRTLAMKLYQLLQYRKDFRNVEIPLQDLDTRRKQTVAAEICARET